MPLIRSVLFALALVAIAAMPAAAHPHVWVKAASEVIYAPDGTVTGIRHVWTFDDMFSTYALQGIEHKTKGVYTREELAPLAQTNVESLKEYGFFTYAKADGKKQKFLEPVDYYLEHKGEALVLHFTLPFKTPFKTSKLALEIFDPSYFVDFALQEQSPVRLAGAPANCALNIERPKDATPMPSQMLSERNFLDETNAGNGAMFANKITVACP